MKVAIVHDWLVNFAGADRVVDQMMRVFPDAVIYTLVYRPEAFPGHFRKYDVRTTYIQKIPMAAHLYKNMLSLMPRAFESLDLTEYDLVISSSSSCSKGVITRPDALHICYCHTPVRYVWSHYHEYLSNASWLKRRIMPGIIHRIRLWDFAAAQRVDLFLANSRNTAQRIRKYYRRTATVIYPGVHLDEKPAAETDDGYYLMVGRFVAYKRFDLGIEACTRSGRKLIVAGGGDLEAELKKKAGGTVTFIPSPDDERIRELYRHARALIFPGDEDFGIVPVEAQSCGCPVLAYGRGGACETILDGESGILFREQSVESVLEAMDTLEEKGVSMNRGEIRQSVQRFSEERFREEFRVFVERAWRERNQPSPDRFPVPEGSEVIT